MHSRGSHFTRVPTSHGREPESRRPRDVYSQRSCAAPGNATCLRSTSTQRSHFQFVIAPRYTYSFLALDVCCSPFFRFIPPSTNTIISLHYASYQRQGQRQTTSAVPCASSGCKARRRLGGRRSFASNAYKSGLIGSFKV